MVVGMALFIVGEQHARHKDADKSVYELSALEKNLIANVLSPVRCTNTRIPVRSRSMTCAWAVAPSPCLNRVSANVAHLDPVVAAV